jgi:hypothetical protein
MVKRVLVYLGIYRHLLTRFRFMNCMVHIAKQYHKWPLTHALTPFHVLHLCSSPSKQASKAFRSHRNSKAQSRKDGERTFVNNFSFNYVLGNIMFCDEVSVSPDSSRLMCTGGNLCHAMQMPPSFYSIPIHAQSRFYVPIQSLIA